MLLIYIDVLTKKIYCLRFALNILKMGGRIRWNNTVEVGWQVVGVYYTIFSNLSMLKIICNKIF